MLSHTFRIALTIFAFSFLSACASMKSMSHDKKVRPGLGYYLPNGDIKVTMTRTTDAASGTTSDKFKIETVYYADVSKRYSVTIPKNPAGDTQMSVKVNTAGLLVSSEYKYEPKIIEAIANIPLTVSTNNQAIATSTPCSADGDYVQTIDVAHLAADRKALLEVYFCGFTVRITPIGRQPRGGEYDYKDSKKPKNGLFFRMNMPYRVEIFSSVLPARTLHSEIALSPSGADALFLRLNRSLFSKAEGKLGFDNGVLTAFEPKNSSEIESGFKLPASILKAYFESVSGLLAFRSKRIENEVAYMAAQEKYKQAQAELRACQDAYASGKPDLIDATCKDPDKKD